MTSPRHTNTARPLASRVCVVTGAGRGIGLETARALAALGARVVVAEIDETAGVAAAEGIRAEHGADAATFIATDVAEPASLRALAERVAVECGDIDIVVNNATVTPFGPVVETSLQEWDLSYRVNLRGPVELARLTLPGMLERRYGVFVCLSSVGGAFMAPYEALKAAQAELAATLAAELDGTGVFAFTVGPGQVDTPGLRAGVERLAPLYGMSGEEFLSLNAERTTSAEEAGTGIAFAVLFAERFHGTETSPVAGWTAWREATAASNGDQDAKSSIQPEGGRGGTLVEPAGAGEASLLAREVHAAFLNQLRGWRERGVFERKWMERDFRRHAGMSPEEALSALDALVAAVDRDEPTPLDVLDRLRGYYDRYEGLARDHTRDPKQLEAALDAIDEWRRGIDALAETLGR